MNLDKALALLLFISLIYTVVTYNLVNGFKQLPSLLYGGDYYHQLGVVYNIMYNSIEKWFDGSIPGSNVQYLPVYAIVVGIFGKVFDLIPMDAMLYLNLLLPLISLTINYLLFEKVFKNKKAAIIGALILVPFNVFPILKYTDFTAYIIIPVFIYSLFLFFESQTIGSAAILGIVYGLLSVSHGTGLVIGSFFILAVAIFILSKELKKNNFKIESKFIHIFLLCLVVAVVGFLIAQLYWYKAIFVLLGNMPSRQTEWNVLDFSSPTYQVLFLLYTISNYFLSISSISKIIMSIMSIMGIYAIIQSLRRHKTGTEKEKTLERFRVPIIFTAFLFTSAFLLTFSYFFTRPLLNADFIPNYIDYLILRPAVALLAVTGYIFFTNKYDSNFVRTYLFYLLLLLFAISSVMLYPDWYNDQWKAIGRTPLPDKTIALQTFLIKNTNIDDVVLTSNELGFMINAISGRKVIATIRAQTDPFFDFDSEQMITAKILYGNNSEERSKLLKENNITYVFYDNDWLKTEWSLNKDGRIDGWSDPLLLFDTIKNREELGNYNISYYPTKTWVNSILRGQEFKQLDVLLISPGNYYLQNNKGIWKNDLYKYLKPVWNYSNPNTGELSILYRVVT